MTRDRTRWLGAWGAIIGATLALAFWNWTHGLHLSAADYAQYLAHARALAEGRPYTDTGYIFTPINPWAGPQAQPPGLPLVLSVVFRTVGESTLAIDAVMLIATLGFYILAGRYFARLGDPRLGLAVVLLLGFSTEIARSTMLIQSDLLFCCLVWAVIILYDREGPFTVFRIAAITAVGALTIATRTFGVVLIPAALLFTLLNWQQHRFRPAIPVAIWLAAFLIANMVLPITSGFPDVSVMVRRVPVTVLDHVPAYRFALFGAQHYPFPWNRANDLYHVLATALTLAGLAAWGREALRRFSVVFCAGYVVLLLIVPVVASRYMWVVYPLVGYGLARGLAIVAGRLFRRQDPVRPRPGLALAAVALIAVLNVAWAGPPPETRAPTLEGIPEVKGLFGALKDLAKKEPVRVMFMLPQVLALETRIPSAPTFRATPEVTLAELNRLCITHVVLGDLGFARSWDADLRETVRVYPEAFRLEYRNAEFELHRYTRLACRRDLREGWQPQP